MLIARTAADVLPVLRAAEAAALDGAWAAGFFSYEAAPGFDSALVTHHLHDLPLAWFAVFDTASPPQPLPSDDSRRASHWQPRISEAEYARGFAAIKEAIADGVSYQANYTLRLDAQWTGVDPWARYGALIAAHRPPYAACLDLDDVVVVSVSPELLLQRRSRLVTTIPMKGTARRGRWGNEDRERGRALAASAKDRAENVMIVDLSRNDLGRVCDAGSITVPSLFEVQRYRTAWHMVSTVTGQLRPEVTLTDALAAVFPAGSITGAPKTSTMRLIRQLEPDPRGIYCGSIGVIAPGGDATFNVAIRTAVFERRTERVTLGIGGGITWDSAPAAELAEARLKATFLDVPPSFELLETMRVDGSVVERWARHLARLVASAAYFDIPLHPERVDAAVHEHLAAWTGTPRRVRLTVAQDGAPHVTSSALDGSLASATVALSAVPVASDDPFLCHKTTHRVVYDAQRAARPDVFDVLLINDHGELTEFTIGNVVLEIDGRRLTPPRDAGLLAGVFREELLATGHIEEARLTPADLSRASAVWLINSVRGWVDVTFVV